MKATWMQLSGRDKQIIIVGGVFIVLILFYVFILSPLKNAVDSQAAIKKDNEALIVWMKNADSQLSTLTASQRPGEKVTDQAALSIIQQSLSNAAIGASTAEIKQNPDKTIVVQFKSVNFDGLIAWQISLWNRYQINVDRCDIEALEEAGMVQASVVLKS